MPRHLPAIRKGRPRPGPRTSQHFSLKDTYCKYLHGAEPNNGKAWSARVARALLRRLCNVSLRGPVVSLN